MENNKTLKNKKKLDFLLGSKSIQKIQSLDFAANIVFNSDDGINNIYALDVSSGINAQPIGEETLQGAINRLDNAKRYHTGNYDFAIGIENGIFECNSHFDGMNANSLAGEKKKWLDFAYIVIEHRESAVIYVQKSASVEIPSNVVINLDEVKSKTIGDYISEIYPDAGSKDPHKFLLKNNSSRIKILADAIELGFYGLLQKINLVTGKSWNDYNYNYIY